MEIHLRLDICLLILFSCCIICDGLNNGYGKGRSSLRSESQNPIYNGLGHANGDHQMRQASVARPRVAKPRQGLGLSAWGIIGILAGSVGFGTLLYYTALFYPILCKKERKSRNLAMNDCCPTAPPAFDNTPAVSTPV